MRSSWVNRGVGRALRNYELNFFLIGPDQLSLPERNAHVLPTASWVKEQTYAITHRASFRDMPPGKYQLAISLHDPRTRRQIALPLREKTERGAYLIGSLEAF